MSRALPAPLAIRWTHVAVATYVAVTAVAFLLLGISGFGSDWDLFTEAGRQLATGANPATGWGDEWVAALLRLSGEAGPWIVSPASALGPLWLLALPLTAYLTWKGRLGLAALAISPYWTPAYLLMLLLELRSADPVDVELRRRVGGDLGVERAA